MSSSAAPKRGPYASTLRRRESVAQAAYDLIHEVGHEAVTIGQVAERAGTSEATVLYHFATKDHLLVAALQLEDFAAMARTHADESTVLSLSEFQAAASATSREDPMLRLYLSMRGQAASPEHPAWAYLESRNTLQIDVFTRLIRGRQDEGLAHPGLDPERTAIQLIAMWEGLTSLWFTGVAIDIGEVLVDAIRRITGENVMEARALIREREFGL